MTTEHKTGDLKIWWGTARDPFFEMPVNSVKEALLVLKTLAEYEAFREGLARPLVYRIDPHLAGLVVWDEARELLDGHKWRDWRDEQGRYVDEVLREEAVDQ